MQRSLVLPATFSRAPFRTALVVTTLGMFCLIPFVTLADAAERPPASQLLPQRTVFFVRTPSVKTSIEAFQKTNLGRMMADAKMRPFLSGFWQNLADEFKSRAEEGELDLTLDELSALPAGEVCLAGVGLRGEGLKMAMIMDVAPDNDVAERLLFWARSRGDSDPYQASSDHRGFEIQHWQFRGEQDVYLCRRENTYLFSQSENLMRGMLDLWDKLAVDLDGKPVSTLGNSSQFITVYRRLQGGLREDPNLLVYVDPIEAVRVTYGETPAGFAAMTMIPALGLDGLRAVGLSVYMDTPDFDSVTRIHVLLDQPRIGVLQAVALGEVDPAPSDFVPEDVTQCLSLQIEREEMVEGIREVYDSYFGADGLSKWMDKNLSDNFGIDFEQEFVNQVEGRITFATWTEPPVRFNSGANLIGIRVDDPAAVRTTLIKALESVGERRGTTGVPQLKNHLGIEYWSAEAPSEDEMATRRREREERLKATGRESEIGRVELETRQPQPSFALLGNTLIGSDSEAFLKRAIETYKGDMPRFRDSLTYLSVSTKIRRILGSRAAALVQINNNELALRQWYDFAVGDSTKSFLTDRSEENPLLGKMGKTLEENPLPDFEELQSYFAPSGAMVFEEETGLHYMTFTIRREQDPVTTP